ncbi:hypothetical protein BKP42_34450 [Rhodococcus erythropolis]|nr:hypothetical protein BKP42_34450 [Rhodococcus erythropolis]
MPSYARGGGAASANRRSNRETKEAPNPVRCLLRLSPYFQRLSPYFQLGNHKWFCHDSGVIGMAVSIGQR